MLQAWLVVAPTSKFYILSTVLFNKDEGANIEVKNCMSHFSMFVPTNSTVKLSNGNTGHAQGIGVILCRFPKFSIIYPVGPVYYCSGHPSNTISSGALKFYIGLKMLHLNLLNIVTLLTLNVVLGDHPTRLATILTIFTRRIQDQSSQKQEYCCLNCLWTFKKSSLSTYSSAFWSCIYQLENEWQEKDLWKVFQKISMNWNSPSLSISWPRQIKLLEVHPLMS